MIHPYILLGWLLKGAVLWIVLIGTYIFYKVVRSFQMQNHYTPIIEKAKQRKIKQKEDLRKRLSPRDGDLLNPHRERILSLSLEELIGELQSSMVSPLDVLQAYQAKAILADDKTNCIVEFIEDAESQALELDQIPNKKDYPLYGVPLSVKECLILKGTDSTAGLAKYLFQPSEEDCGLVEAMRTLGVIPFARTNNPQMLKSFGCSNPIYGSTTNPYNSLLTAGGSSGGEAALVAEGGSILGIGSDVGGSLRIPAHFCGICSLKPTYGRVQPPFLVCSSGFMCKRVESLIKVHEIFSNNSRRFADIHYSLVPLSWNKALLSKPKLRIGWFEYNNYFEPVPACSRALHECIRRLSLDGHNLIKINDPGTPDLVEKVLQAFQSDGGQQIRSVVDEKERIDDCYRINYYMAYVPEFIKLFLGGFIFKYILPSKILHSVSMKGALTGPEIWGLAGYFQAFSNKVHEEWWKTLDLDVVITPGFGFPAIPNAEASTYLPAAAFTAVYNILDLPAGTVPVTNVTEEDIEKLKGYPYVEDKNEYLFHRLKKKQENTKGCPVGVQVIGRKWQEEAVLHAMKIIQDLHQEPTPPPTCISQ